MMFKFSLRLGCWLLFATCAAAQSTVGWTLVWSDEFTQTNGSSPDASKWVFETGAGGWGNNELQYYTSRTNNARIENNQLVIEARQESYMGSAYTSARLKTQGKASWRYGRMEARIKITRTQGLWPAFWMLGTNITSVGWPTCGEIDIMENIGSEPAMVHGTIHGPGYSGGNGIGSAYSLPGNPAFADDFHIYAIEWTTNQIKWFVDGLQYFSVNPARLPPGSAWVYQQPQFILLNVAVGGTWPGNPNGTTVLPQRMVVDYVRVYAPTNLQTCGVNMLANPGLESGSFANWTTYGAGFNTLLENINGVPVHNGTNVFKLFGQFNGSENYSGMLQDVAASPGQSFTASGWILTPSGDSIAGANTAWLELTFRGATNNVLALFRSATINTNTPIGCWLKLPITNQFDSVSFALIGTVTNLVAPPGTSVARYQVVFRQPQSANGAVLFDDLKISASESAEVSVPRALAVSGGAFNLSFPTYLGQAYRVRFKNDLSQAFWQTLTNVVGDGREQALADWLGSTPRFFHVTRDCN